MINSLPEIVNDPDSVKETILAVIAPITIKPIIEAAFVILSKIPLPDTFFIKFTPKEYPINVQ